MDLRRKKMPNWLNEARMVALQLLPGGLWCAWWLWGVNWKKAWPVLSRGAWVPVLLLIILAALVWSRIAPSRAPLFGGFSIANFWWQLGSVIALALVALFCGWVQGKLDWTPGEVSFDPPAGHSHGHH
jgi:hypothetical protein